MKKLLLLMLCFCTPALASISVEDFAGRTVQLEKPARRIIALAPHITENIFSAGAGGYLVGAVTYSNYPEAAKAIQRIGSHLSWSLESIVALQPDLIVMWGSGNGMQHLPALERMGVPVFVSEPRLPTDIARAIRSIGVLAATEETAEIEAEKIERGLTALEAKYHDTKQLKVFYQVWNEPLQTLNGDHLISHVIKLCGGKNIFWDAPYIAPKINIESILMLNPDVIVASGMATQRPEWLDDWLAYPSISAVANNALYSVNPDHIQRPTTRLLLGAEKMCRLLADARAKL